MTLLSRREYTAHEVQTKLVERGCSADDATAVVGALVSQGLVDDRRAAGAHVRTAARIKGRGRHRIERELEARGIPTPIVRDALGDLTPQAEIEAIRRILARKRTPFRRDPAMRRRLFQHLLRRGFSSDVVAKALREKGQGEASGDEEGEEIAD
ncbi:MAG TPA: regulatory protein RecX, partial [Vicinamibacterales bacterium]